MLGKLPGEDEAHSRLDLPGGDGGLLVVARQASGLGSDLLEDVVDEGVHDGHRLGGDPGLGVDLLEHLVDVDLVGLGLGLPALAGATLGGLLGGLLVGLLGTGRGGWDVSRSAGGVGVAFGRGVAGSASSSQRVIPELSLIHI